MTLRPPCLPAALALGLALLAIPARADESLLERDVLPLLTRSCLGCHGGLRQKGGLDLRTVPAMLRGGDSGPAVKAGDLTASGLWKRVESDEMPPSDKKLTPAEKDVLRQWITGGLPTVAARQKDDPLLAPGKKHAVAEVAAAIDRHLDAGLAAARLTPAPAADDAEFLRRAYLDLTGRVPTPEQAAAFLDSRDPDRRARLIDQLLATPQFGEQLGRTWRDWVCPPALPSDANSGKQPHKEARDFGKWLGGRLAAGDGWDAIVRDVLTADGEIKNSPQVVFFGLVGEGGKPTPAGATRAVGSLFMGVQLQCSECHDDPYRPFAQKEFWAAAAFFRKTTGGFNKITEPTSAGKPGDGIVIPPSAFKNAGTNVPAAFPGGKPFATEKDGPLRQPFAEWLTARDNPYFARSFTNRTWFYFFARGIVHPVDDFRELNPPSHPGLLRLLANEFADSGFDVKHLVRCICNSKAYQRTSRVPAGTPDDDLPAFVTVDAGFDLRTDGGRLYRSVPAYLGPQHAPLAVNDPRKGLDNLRGADADLADRLELLARGEGEFAREYALPTVSARQAAFDRAVRLMRSRRAAAFDIEKEPAKVREEYGSHRFGQSCLLARRLVEAGVSFVEVVHRGWDDHGGAAGPTRSRAPWLDAAMSALIRDLDQRGLLDDTLVVWMGEFGRTPGNGEGHFSSAWSTVWAGGGIKTGQVIGKTSEGGKKPGSTVVERPISAADYVATLCLALGMDIHQEFMGPGRRPMPLADKAARPITELLP